MSLRGGRFERWGAALALAALGGCATPPAAVDPGGCSQALRRAVVVSVPVSPIRRSSGPLARGGAVPRTAGTERRLLLAVRVANSRPHVRLLANALDLLTYGGTLSGWARVVRRGFAPASYAAALLTGTALTAPATPQTLGLIKRRAPSGRRIHILATPPRPWWPWATVPLYALTGLLALAAGTFPAPPIDAALGWPYPSGMRHTPGHGVQLAPPENAAQRLAWLTRALAARPNSVSLVLLKKNLGQTWHQQCGVQALDARLRTLDPRNGVGWLDALQAAVASNDTRGIDAALGAIGNTRHVDVGATELSGRLAEALHRMGGESYFSATEQLQYVHGNQAPFKALVALEQTCTPHGTALGARRLTGCRAAVVALGT